MWKFWNIKPQIKFTRFNFQFSIKCEDRVNISNKNLKENSPGILFSLLLSKYSSKELMFRLEHLLQK